MNLCSKAPTSNDVEMEFQWLNDLRWNKMELVGGGFMIEHLQGLFLKPMQGDIPTIYMFTDLMISYETVNIHK